MIVELNEQEYEIAKKVLAEANLSLADKIANAKAFNGDSSKTLKTVQIVDDKWTSAKFFKAIVQNLKEQGLAVSRDLNMIIIKGVGEFIIDEGDDLRYYKPTDVKKVKIMPRGVKGVKTTVFMLDMSDVNKTIKDIVNWFTQIA